MTTFKPLTLDAQRRTLKTCQRMDYEMRLSKYPAVLDADGSLHELSADRCATEGHVLVGTGDNRVVCDECDVEMEPRDAEQFFLEQQSPSDASFR